MRNIFRLIIFSIILLSLEGIQSQNLVPNPSFEEYDDCPNTGSQLEKATNWHTYYISPDYYNSCATESSGFSIPDNWIGSQCSANGNAFIGIYTYLPGPNLFREIVYAELDNPLEIGIKYYIKIKANLPDYSPCASNNIGILFTTTDDTTQNLLNNFSHLRTETIITESNSWTTIEGEFTSDSSYKYIFIGNFYDNAHTDTLKFSGFYCNSYYYIDDICVSSDSLACKNISSQVLDFSSNEQIIHQGDSINFSINSIINYDSFEWFFEGGLPNISYDVYPNVLYIDTGTYEVKLIGNNNSCKDSIIKKDYIIVEKNSAILEANVANKLIYPTISNGDFIVYIPEKKIFEIFLFDMTGKKIECSFSYLDSNKVFVKSLNISAGVYSLIILGEKTYYEEKIIIY